MKKYREPIELIIGSHSALDARYGARNYGFRSVIYTTEKRARIYLQNPIVGESGEAVEDLPELVKRDMICVRDPPGRAEQRIRDTHYSKDRALTAADICTRTK